MKAKKLLSLCLVALLTIAAVISSSTVNANAESEGSTLCYDKDGIKIYCSAHGHPDGLATRINVSPEYEQQGNFSMSLKSISFNDIETTIDEQSQESFIINYDDGSFEIGFNDSAWKNLGINQLNYVKINCLIKNLDTSETIETVFFDTGYIPVHGLSFTGETDVYYIAQYGTSLPYGLVGSVAEQYNGFPDETYEVVEFKQILNRDCKKICVN